MSYADTVGIDDDLYREVDREPIEHRPVVVDAPTLEKAGAGYLVTYPGVGIEVRVDRLRIDHGTSYCHLRIFSLPRVAGHAKRLLTRGSFNLDSPQVRRTWAKDLRPGFEADWVAVLESLSNAVLSSEEQGQPAMKLRDAMMPTYATSVLPPLVLSRLPCCWFGDGAAMKSYMALAAGLSIHTGIPLLGIEPTVTMRVGYLDWEFDAWEHKKRMLRLLGGDLPDDALPDIVYVPMARSLVRDFERVGHIVAEEGLEFLILDSVGYAVDGPLNDDPTARGFHAAARELNTGILALAHTTKFGEAASEKPFGSTFWHNSFRATWFVKKQSEAGSHHVDVGFFNRKANTDMEEPPFGISVAFEPGHVRLTPTSIHDVAELSRETSLKDRIKHLLQTGAMTAKQIAEELDTSDDVVRVTLRRAPDVFTSLTATAGQSQRYTLRARG